MMTTVLVGVASSTPALAYVRYRSKNGCPYAWRTRTVAIKEFPQGLPDVDEATIATAVTEAAKAWTQGDPLLTQCTDLQLDVTPMSLSDTPPTPKFDQINNVVFVSADWCASPPGECREPLALAITTVFARTSGEIVDADVEVNATDFQWGDLVTTPALGGKHDLQNALTHEMGHFIGLDHTCYAEKAGTTAPIDENGQPVPSCFDLNLSEAVRMTTMFASAEPGDVSKRSLEADDLQAVCATYPRGAVDPLQCANEQTGCAVAPQEPAAEAASWRLWLTASLGLAALLAAVLVRRSRSGPS